METSELTFGRGDGSLEPLGNAVATLALGTT